MNVPFNERILQKPKKFNLFEIENMITYGKEILKAKAFKTSLT